VNRLGGFGRHLRRYEKRVPCSEIEFSKSSKIHENVAENEGGEEHPSPRDTPPIGVCDGREGGIKSQCSKVNSDNLKFLSYKIITGTTRPSKPIAL
jgi:hypothetical protein